MDKKRKIWTISLCSLFVIGATTAIVAEYFIHKHDKPKQKQEEVKEIKNPETIYIMQEDEALTLYNKLTKDLHVSEGRANMLINEVNSGHITEDQLKDIIKHWNDKAENE